MDTVESYYYMYTGTCRKETRENSKGETVKGPCTLYTVRLSIISDISDISDISYIITVPTERYMYIGGFVELERGIRLKYCE